MAGKTDKKATEDVPCFNEIILKKLLASYSAYSEESQVRLSPDIVNNIKQCLAENLSLTKLLVRPIDRDLKAEDKIRKALAIAEGSNDLDTITDLKQKLKTMFTPTLLGPVIKPLNELQVNTLKSLIIIDTPIYYEDAVHLTNWVKMMHNKVKKIEIEDCCIQVDSLRKFSTCFNLQKNLTSICLDYNEFGDAGCIEICRGMQNNKTLLTLSMCYCGLSQASGAYLGQILSTTALKELFLDGNDLRCYGCQDLIRVVAQEAEKMAMQRLMEKKLKAEEKERLKAEGFFEPEEEKKKKKKKGGKKKKGKEPPLVGPYVTKLHLADNGIDYYEEGHDKIKSLRIIHDTISMFVKLIEYSPEVEEIDIHNNTIGNMSATLLVNALEMRRLKKVGSLAVRVSEKIEPEIFASILKLSKKVKKKKGGKRKQKSSHELIYENEKNLETLERVIISSMSQSMSLLDNENYQNPPSRRMQADSDIINFEDVNDDLKRNDEDDDDQDKTFINLEEMHRYKERKHREDIANNRERYSDRYTPTLFLPRI